jgi:Secretion system C-terminal sorting domain
MNSLRWLLTAVFLLCLIPLVNADVVWPEENGVSVFQAQLTTGESFVAGDNDGYSFVVWGDESNGERNIQGQLIDPNHLPLWPVDGLPLVNLPEFQNAIGVVHSDDGWIVAWLDRRDLDGPDWYPEYNLALFIQKFDYNGVPQWNDEEQPPENGVLVENGSFPSTNYDINLLSDGNGGAYVTFVLEDFDEHTAELIAQHVLSDGSFDWTSWGINLMGPEGIPSYAIDDVSLVPADDGDGFTAAWIARPDPPDREIRAQRIDSDGNLWPYDSAPIIGESEILSIDNLGVCSDGAGGMYAAWLLDNGQINVQRIGADGSLPWTDVQGQIIAGYNASFNPSLLVSSSNNTAILFWGADGSHAQRFGGDTELELFWGNTGINISPVPGAIHKDALADGSGGAVVFFDVIYDFTYLQHLDMDGTALSEEPLSIEGTRLYHFAMTPAGNDRIAMSCYLSDGHTAIRYQSYDLLTHQLHFPLEGLNLTSDIVRWPNDIHIAVQDGIPFFAWYDGRHYPYGEIPILQALDPQTGQKLFGENGQTLLPGYTFGGDDSIHLNVEDLDIAATGDNALVISCSGRITPEWVEGLILQKATIDGELLWGDQGVLFSPDNCPGFNSGNAFGTDDGGAILVFNYLDDDYWLRLGMQQFNANGEPLWSSGDYNFIPFGPNPETGDYDLIEVTPFSDGSLLVLMQTHQPREYYVHRLSRDGEEMWDEPVLVGSEHNRNISMMPFGENMLLAMPYAVLPDEHMEIMGQVITIDGELLWGEEQRVLIDDAGWIEGLRVHISMAEEESFWLAYISEDESFARVYAQRFNSSGQPLIVPDVGVLVHESTDRMVASENMIHTLPDNSIYLSWSTKYDAPLQVEYRRLNPNGSFPVQYINGPLTISSMFHVDAPTLVSDGDGGAYAWWTSQTEDILPTSTTRLFAQRLNDGFARVDEPSAATPDGWVLHAAYPNPFNATTRVTIDLTHAAEMRVKLFDVLGREVMTIANERLTPGRHNLTVDASTLASGMYFLSVEQIGGMKKLQKLVVLK